jgi:predicted Zn-dependent protease with MMP-like domain
LEPCELRDGPRCRSIVFYRKNLIRFAHSRQELDDQVRITLLHELGHLQGEDDDELRDRGLE